MANRERRSRRRRDSDSRRADWEAEAKPFELKPMELRDEPASEMPSLEVRSRDIPLVDFGDRSAPARRIEEHRFEFRDVVGNPFELRREAEHEIRLTEIPVSETQMRSLEARRLNSRDLGWNVSGRRVRVDNADDK